MYKYMEIKPQSSKKKVVKDPEEEATGADDFDEEDAELE